MGNGTEGLPPAWASPSRAATSGARALARRATPVQAPVRQGAGDLWPGRLSDAQGAGGSRRKEAEGLRAPVAGHLPSCCAPGHPKNPVNGLPRKSKVRCVCVCVSVCVCMCVCDTESETEGQRWRDREKRT